MNTPLILLLGIGQSLRGDDAAGLEAVRLWQAAHPLNTPGLEVQLSELPGLALLELLSGRPAALLVDAVRASAAPGTLQRLGPDELAAFTSDAQSAHGWGVAETLALGRTLYPDLADCRISLIGIVGAQFELGAGLSPAVQAALPAAAGLIEKELQDLFKA
jgi:hydrogenase maturation protease